MNPNSELFELENLRSELIEKIFESNSNSSKLYYYYQYFQKTISFNDSKIAEAFLSEFIADYLLAISSSDLWGIKPDLLNKILIQLKKLNDLEPLSIDNFQLDEIKKYLEDRISQLKLILDGEPISIQRNNKAYFPLLHTDSSNEITGIIDCLTIHISKSSAEKIIIVPSEIEIEKKLSEQCSKSWYLALELLKQYVRKLYKYHEVIINFDKREGFYEGNSLGIALTLSFLDALLKFYNPSYEINIKELVAFTGGVKKSGEVIPIGEDLIKQKVELIFFSPINSFIVPKSDEEAALSKLNTLKETYPKRKLKIISVEDISDILNRRDVVDIRKRNYLLRTGKFIKNNWISAAASVLMALLFAYLFVMDFDDNPASLTTDGNLLFVRNKNGKILWTKKIDIGRDQINNQKILGMFFNLYDIDDDGINEVLIANEATADIYRNKSRGELNCYNKNNEKVWSFYFDDSVSSDRESLDRYYTIFLIDTLTFNFQKSLFLISTNSASFSSAIYRINLTTGRRLPGTLWCSGHTTEALIKDLNDDGRKDILAIGMDNGFEQQVVFAFTIDTLTKVRPSINEYIIKNFPISDFLSYIRIPKTDYTKYIQVRVPGVEKGSLVDEIFEKVYRFIIQTGFDYNKCSIWIKLNYNLKDIDFVVDNQFRVIRDSLVAQGKLLPPYTDTYEYREILKSNILYWKADSSTVVGGKWVKREELRR